MSIDLSLIESEDLRDEIQNQINQEINGLKANRDDLLSEKKKLTAQFDEYRKKYANINDDELKEALDLYEKAKKQQYIDSDKVDEYVQKESQRIRNDYEAKLQAELEKNKRSEENVNKYHTLYKNKIIEDVIIKTAINSGCLNNSEVIRDIVRRGKDVFALDESERNLEARDATGKLIKTKNGEKILTPSEWLDELRDTCPHFFPQSHSTGASSMNSNLSRGQSDVRAKMEAAAQSKNFEEYRRLKKEL